MKAGDILLLNLANLAKHGGEMNQVNILEAKNNLSSLIQSLERRETDTITIARNGKPVAKLSLFNDNNSKTRIGVAKGKFVVPDNFDWCNDEIAEMFEGGVL